jgi:hypothetical protein
MTNHSTTRANNPSMGTGERETLKLTLPTLDVFADQVKSKLATLYEKYENVQFTGIDSDGQEGCIDNCLMIAELESSAAEDCAWIDKAQYSLAVSGRASVQALMRLSRHLEIIAAFADEIFPGRTAANSSGTAGDLQSVMPARASISLTSLPRCLPGFLRDRLPWTISNWVTLMSSSWYPDRRRNPPHSPKTL